jgi:S1-C subfamily serine protease
VIRVLVLGVAAAITGLAAWAEPGPEAPRLVGVVVSGPGDVPEVATGFLAGDRRVVTVAHVLDSGGAVTIRGANGARQPARVVRVARADDLALLALDGGVAPVARAPLRAPVRREIAARIRDSAGAALYTRDALELDASVTAGDSGSPVIDGDGRLRGVLFASSAGRPGVAYAVDAGAVDRLLRP